MNTVGTPAGAAWLGRTAARATGRWGKLAALAVAGVLLLAPLRLVLGQATTPSFSAATNPGAGSGPVSVAVADVNGDGKVDLLVANATNVLVLLNQTAAGATTPSFAGAQNFSAIGNPDAVAAVDVNGDGRPDLLVALNGIGNVAVRLN